MNKKHKEDIADSYRDMANMFREEGTERGKALNILFECPSAAFQEYIVERLAELYDLKNKPKIENLPAPGKIGKKFSKLLKDTTDV